MNRNLLALGALVALLSLPCCKTSSPDPTPPTPANPLTLLPAETQVGANTFGCLVNGKVYSTVISADAHGDWTFSSANKIAIYGYIHKYKEYNNDYLSISFLLNGQLSPSFNPAPFNIISSATPYPTFTPGINQFHTSANGTSTPCYYHGAYFKTGGQVVLTKFDGVARIASGRFAFTLYEPGSCDTLRVTNGRFDVKF